MEKTIYERCATIADALEGDNAREEFAQLLEELTEHVPDYRRTRRAVSVRRWLKDAGWR
jgi:hypothetical protein